MIKVHPSLLGLALCVALAACRPGAAEYTESEAPNRLTLDNASRGMDVRFARGSSRLAAADAAKLRAAVADGVLTPTDRVTVAAGGTPALANARAAAVASELLRYGIIANQVPVAGVAPDRAVIQSGRYMVTLPSCPNWSKQSSLDFTNTNSSNFGCATMSGLGMMVAYPADLAEGRPVGYADAIPAAAAVQRYQAERVQLPAGANITPIASTSAAAPGGAATGAGTAGSQP
jgi:pilus assembly protein CpaD